MLPALAIHTSIKFVQNDGTFAFIAARKTVIAVKTPLAHHRVLQIVYSKKDGSIFVQSPYFQYNDGIISRVTLRDDDHTVDLKDHGHIAHHKPKLSHHVDGSVRFTQDGLLRSTSAHQSFRLDTGYGRLFECVAERLSGFALHEQASKDEALVTYEYFSTIPRGVHILGEWRRIQDLRANMGKRTSLARPVEEVFDQRIGARVPTLFLGQPNGYPLTSHLLMLTIGEASSTTLPDNPGLLLVGGFDHSFDGAVYRVGQKHFLACMYPVVNHAQIAQRIGCIDFVKTPPSVI